MGPAVLLIEAFGQNIFDIVFTQSGLELLFTGGVDSFPDDHWLFADFHSPGIGRDHCPAFSRIRNKRKSLFRGLYAHSDRVRGNTCISPDCLHGLSDVFRGRAAAAAHSLYAHGGNLFHPCRKHVGGHIVHGPAVLRPWKSRIGIDQDGNRGSLGQPLYDGDHLLGPHTAVDAESVDPQSLQHSHCRVHCTACQQFSAFVIDIGDQDRKAAVLLCRQNSRLGLVAVAHRLDQHQVRSRSRTDAYDLPEKLHSLFKRKISQGLQKTSCGPDIQRNVGILAVGTSPGFLCQFHCRLDDPAKLTGLRELQGIGAKCICIENITPRLQVSAVQIDDVFRPEQIPPFRQFASFEPFFLQDRSCPAVKKKPFFSQTL